MPRPKIATGHETHQTGLISLYAGLEHAPGFEPGFFVASKKQKRLNRKQFKRLDDTLRFGTEQESFVLLTSNEHKYFWRRVAAQLNRCFPNRGALCIFLDSWRDTL